MSKSILFVSNSGPYPPKDGKKQRSLALLKALEQNYQVDYLIIDHYSDYQLAKKYNENPKTNFFYASTNPSHFQVLFKKIGVLFFKDKKIQQRIAEQDQEKTYQFIFSRYINPVSYIPAGMKIVVDIDDDFKELYQSRIRQAPSFFKKIRLFQIYYLNLGSYKQLLKKITLPIVVKEEKGFKDALILPNLPFQLLFKKSIEFKPCSSPSILFVGKLTYEPNLQGIKWFIKEVYPRLLNDFPNLHLTIVSSLDVQDSELELLISKYPSIQKMINLRDIQEAYHQHALVIAPIFQGAGTNLKVIEALLMGRPVVSTSLGARGFEGFSDNKWLVVTDDSPRYYFEISRFFKNKNKVEEIQNMIFQASKNQFNFEKWSNKLNLSINFKI